MKVRNSEITPPLTRRETSGNPDIPAEVVNSLMESPFSLCNVDFDERRGEKVSERVYEKHRMMTGNNLKAPSKHGRILDDAYPSLHFRLRETRFLG